MEAWKVELRYYLRVAVTLAATILAARYGIKLDPPPLQVQPVTIKLDPPLTSKGD